MPNRVPSRQSNRIAAMSNRTNENITTTVTTTNTTNTTTTSISPPSISGLDRTILPNVTPLMSIRLPPEIEHPTTSSPEEIVTITTPEYSSLTAQGIREAYARSSALQNQRLPTLRESVHPDMPVNNDGLSLRDYVGASVGAAEANIMRSIQENLAVMIPRIVRESLRSERINSTNNSPNDITNNAHNNHNNNNTLEAQNRTNFQLNDTPAGEQQFYFQPYNRQTTNRNFQQPNQPPRHPNQTYDQQRQHTGVHEPRTQFVTQNVAVGYNTNAPHELQKWGIKFDPSNRTLSIEEFVFRAESLRVDYNCPWDVFMRGFHHLLAGNANNWIWGFRHQNPYCTWDHLKYHLIKKFRNFESDFEIQRRIVERRQGPSETSDMYIAEIIKLKNQMRMHIPEYELVRTIKDNLKDGLLQLVFPMDIQTTEELAEVCRRAERSLAKRSSHRQQFTPRRINELEYDETPNEETGQSYQVEALKFNTQPAKQLVCWNCKQTGHSFIECTVEQRNLFCYKCGFDGVTSPKCPRCLGNSQRNMEKPGPTCSPQTSAQ